MVTTVGTENTPTKIIENCLLLEHDAIAAYDAVIERLDNEGYRDTIRAFREDHQRHLDKLREFAGTHGASVPDSGDAKQMLTTGTVKFAGMVGSDGTVLQAMSTNEHDTVAAYKHASENADLPPDRQDFVMEARADEQRHLQWMEETARSA